MKKTKRKSSSNVQIKKELMYQKVTGQYNSRHNAVYTKEGKKIVVTENRPIDDTPFCAPASDHDMVEIVVTSYDKSQPSGYISRVLSRFIEFNVGAIEKKNGNFYLQPFGKRYGEDILLAPGHLNNAIDGSIVTFIVNGIDEYGKYDCYVKDVFANKNDANAFVKGIAFKYGIPTEFSPKCKEAVAAVPSEVESKDKVGRVDLRSYYTITIDGKDTKDRDDAVRCSKLPNGNYELGVDIADVANYVPMGGPIDVEASRRGCSCYAGGQVMPMLDKKLSNGICSLNEKVDRLALSCTMEIDKGGNIIDFRFEETVINVDYNMNYDEIMEIFQGNSETIERYSDVYDMIMDMRDLAKILQKKSKRNGYLEFTSKEAKLIIGNNGKLERIDLHEATEATRIIQSFMIAANISAALYLTRNNYPCVFRVHDLPDEEKIDALCEVLEELGYTTNITSFKDYSRFFQAVIDEVTGMPDEDYVMELLKRTQKKAKYQTTNIGHFGIAEEYYCHFTSPIRRYPDLDVHRAIKACLRNEDDKRLKFEGAFEKDAISSSRAEVKSDTVEREVEKIYKALYMKDHIGEVFTGKISNMSKNGFFVELENTIEGFVFIGGTSKCNFDENKMIVVDRKTGYNYRIGDVVDVRCIDANENLQTIDFELVV